MQLYGFANTDTGYKLGHDFSLEGDNKSHLKFHMKRDVLFIYRMMLRMLGFNGYMINFEVTGGMIHNPSSQNDNPLTEVWRKKR
ncbi:hypothetical protein [Absidia glauca]|uniref:Uncharacterized protein n=1 Tax=Absidia glauca TaxID=4829 RepID=A0A168T572_ABSGL|nr:hypothetical protein [Absidia glauca]